MINLHQQNGRTRGGVLIFIDKSVDFKERKDLHNSNNDSEILSIEFPNKTKSVIFSSAYRLPDSSLKEFESSLKSIFDNIRRNNRGLFLVGDSGLNGLDYENNVKVKKKLLILHFKIPLINKPTRFTRTFQNRNFQSFFYTSNCRFNYFK